MTLGAAVSEFAAPAIVLGVTGYTVYNAVKGGASYFNDNVGGCVP